MSPGVTLQSLLLSSPVPIPPSLPTDLPPRPLSRHTRELLLRRRDTNRAKTVDIFSLKRKSPFLQKFLHEIPVAFFAGGALAGIEVHVGQLARVVVRQASSHQEAVRDLVFVRVRPRVLSKDNRSRNCLHILRFRGPFKASITRPNSTATLLPVARCTVNRIAYNR